MYKLSVLLTVFLFFGTVLMSRETEVQPDFIAIEAKFREKQKQQLFLERLENRELKLTVSNLKRVVEHLDIKRPEVVMAQVKLETGGLRSKICRENNNLFGMKHPRWRLTLSLGVKNKHASYRNWVDSVIDYKLWQEISGLSTKDYFGYLQKRGYAEDPAYVMKLKSILKGTKEDV